MSHLLRAAGQIAHHALSRPAPLLTGLEALALLPVTGEVTDLARLALESYLALGGFVLALDLRNW